MKRYRNLYPQVYDFENLYLSYRAARRAKRGRAEVARFEARVEDELFRLQDELREEVYQPGAYRNFFIYEPKRRKISAAPLNAATWTRSSSFSRVSSCNPCSLTDIPAPR